MTPAELKEIEDHANKVSSSTKSSDHPGPWNALGAGTASGFTLGATGNIGKSGEYSTEAQQLNPKSYGLGYTAGTIGSTLLMPELALPKWGGTAIRAIPKVGPKIAEIGAGIVEKVLPKSSSSDAELAQAANKWKTTGTQKTADQMTLAEQNAAEALGTAPPAPKAESGTFSKMADWIKAVPGRVADTVEGAGTKTGIGVQTIPRIVAPVAGPEPQPVTENDMHSSAEPDNSPNTPFGQLASFLAQAKDSNNPAVQQAANQAQSQVDPSDPDAQRKIAMALQSTPAGRAVGNSDSSLHDEA